MEDWERNVRPCLRSGHCCKSATCGYGVAAGAEPRGCKFLKGDKPGFYYCELAANNPEIASGLYVGEGCCQPMFNPQREEAVRNNPDLIQLLRTSRGVQQS